MNKPLATDPFNISQLCRYFSERSPQPMVAVEGPTHIVRYLNPAFARLAGQSESDLLGHPFAEAIPENAANGCLAMLDRVFRTGIPEYLAEQEHCQIPASFWSYAMWVILGIDEQVAGVMIQVTEATEAAIFRTRAATINEALLVSAMRQHELIDTIKQGEKQRRELEAQMFQAQKLESLGVLAGGIAHDLNNMLTPVLGYTELVSNSLPNHSPDISMLKEVEKNTRLAADLVQQILAFAGKGRFVIQPVDLSSLVRELSGLLNSAISINAKIEYDLAPIVPPVEADITQLRQVIVNLVTNAAEAIGEKSGTITVRTGLQAADAAATPAVFLEVTDTGCGMTADVIAKIFDPFFTTKFTGRGLGLAVVQGITRGHHGTLHVRSEPGQGSTFRLILPCSPNPVAPPSVSQPSQSWRGTGTVLVIDDEAAIRLIVSHILEHAGLTVLAAVDGHDGVRVFSEHQNEINAVILDMTMPKMDGLQTVDRLRMLRPNLPIILMSGYSVAEVTLLSAGRVITGFIQKPFTSLALLAEVRHALQQ